MDALQTDERLIAQLFDNQPDSVVWFEPVFDLVDTALVSDFKVRYANAAACRILNASKAEAIDSLLRSSPLMDETSRSLIFGQCLQVWESGEPIEFTYHSPHF